MRKPAVLGLPIVSSDAKDVFFTEELKGVAQLLKDYETVFFTRRVFVHPKHKDVALSVRDALTSAQQTSSGKTAEGVAKDVAAAQEELGKVTKSLPIVKNGHDKSAGSGK